MERIASRANVLLNNIISFWKGLRDNEFGGYYGFMSQELEVDKKADKGGILNSRILWFFSEAAMKTRVFLLLISHARLFGGVSLRRH